LTVKSLSAIWFTFPFNWLFFYLYKLISYSHIKTIN
jgi:hypothetical protein